MKLKSSIFFVFFFALLSCTSDDPPAPLPEDVTIQITEINLNERRVYLVGTQTENGLEGRWTVESDNETLGVFTSETNSVTSFRGSILERYEIRWTIDNGENFIYSHRPILMSSGAPLNEVVQAERNITKLLNLYSITQLHQAGIAFSEFIEAGLTINNLLEFYRISDLYTGHYVYGEGISITQMLDLGYTLETLYNEFLNDNHATHFVRWFVEEGFTVDELLQIGATVEDIYSHGATVENLVDSSIPLKDLIVRLGFNTIAFLDVGVPLQELMDEGVVEETPISGLYIMNYLFQTSLQGQHTWPIDRINEHYSTSNAQWFIPTKEQLLYVHDNQDQLDLKLDLFASKQRISSTTTICWGSGGVSLPSSVDLRNGSVNTCTDGSQTRTLLPMIQF